MESPKETAELEYERVEPTPVEKASTSIGDRANACWRFLTSKANALWLLLTSKEFVAKRLVDNLSALTKIVVAIGLVITPVLTVFHSCVHRSNSLNRQPARGEDGANAAISALIDLPTEKLWTQLRSFAQAHDPLCSRLRTLLSRREAGEHIECWRECRMLCSFYSRGPQGQPMLDDPVSRLLQRLERDLAAAVPAQEHASFYRAPAELARGHINNAEVFIGSLTACVRYGMVPYDIQTATNEALSLYRSNRCDEARDAIDKILPVQDDTWAGILNRLRRLADLGRTADKFYSGELLPDGSEGSAAVVDPITTGVGKRISDYSRPDFVKAYTSECMRQAGTF